MTARTSPAEPIYGRRIKLPARVFWHGGYKVLSALVHLVTPAYEYYVSNSPKFTGVYACCLGVLRDEDMQFNSGDASIHWEKFLLPDDTPLTCLQCLRNEDIQRGTRKPHR